MCRALIFAGARCLIDCCCIYRLTQMLTDASTDDCAGQHALANKIKVRAIELRHPPQLGFEDIECHGRPGPTSVEERQVIVEPQVAFEPNELNRSPGHVTCCCVMCSKEFQRVCRYDDTDRYSTLRVPNLFPTSFSMRMDACRPCKLSWEAHASIDVSFRSRPFLVGAAKSADIKST